MSLILEGEMERGGSEEVISFQKDQEFYISVLF